MEANETAEQPQPQVPPPPPPEQPQPPPPPPPQQQQQENVLDQQPPLPTPPMATTHLIKNLFERVERCELNLSASCLHDTVRDEVHKQMLNTTHDVSTLKQHVTVLLDCMAKVSTCLNVSIANKAMIEEIRASAPFAMAGGELKYTDFVELQTELHAVREKQESIEKENYMIGTRLDRLESNLKEVHEQYYDENQLEEKFDTAKNVLQPKSPNQVATSSHNIELQKRMKYLEKDLRVIGKDVKCLGKDLKQVWKSGKDLKKRKSDIDLENIGLKAKIANLEESIDNVKGGLELKIKTLEGKCKFQAEDCLTNVAHFQSLANFQLENLKTEIKDVKTMK